MRRRGGSGPPRGPQGRALVLIPPSRNPFCTRSRRAGLLWSKYRRGPRASRTLGRERRRKMVSSARLPFRVRLPFRCPKEAHFCAILASMACGTVLYYSDSLPGIEKLESSVGLALARRSVHRILSILPVAYAAYVFGLRGGLLASSVIAALLLPRVFLEGSDAEEALIEVAAFLFIGAFVSWLIEMQNREKALHKETIVSLERAQRELRSHIQGIENEGRRLSATNAWLGVVSESLVLWGVPK